jgi:hypothetical protein
MNESSGIIPVYNELNFRKNMSAPPEMELRYSKVIPKVKELLSQQESGIIQSIHAIAEVPTQGKNAPSYVKDVMDRERERIIRNYKEDIGKALDDETKMDDFDFDVDRFGNQRTVFFDSEFIIVGVEEDSDKKGGGFIIGVPVSMQDKGYKVKIAPLNVDEIHYTPA